MRREPIEVRRAVVDAVEDPKPRIAVRGSVVDVEEEVARHEDRGELRDRREARERRRRARRNPIGEEPRHEREAAELRRKPQKRLPPIEREVGSPLGAKPPLLRSVGEEALEGAEHDRQQSEMRESEERGLDHGFVAGRVSGTGPMSGFRSAFTGSPALESAKSGVVIVRSPAFEEEKSAGLVVGELAVGADAALAGASTARADCWKVRTTTATRTPTKSARENPFATVWKGFDMTPPTSHAPEYWWRSGNWGSFSPWCLAEAGAWISPPSSRR